MPTSQPSSQRSRSSSRSLLRSQGAHPATALPSPNENRALNLSDLHEIAADIKSTLLAAISDLRGDIQDISARVGVVEITAAHHDTSLCQVQQVTESHAIHLRELHRHLEDLDNHGRHHYLRVRSMSVSIGPNRLLQATIALFNDLLERPQDAPIEMECIHSMLPCQLPSKRGNPEESTEQGSYRMSLCNAERS